MLLETILHPGSECFGQLFGWRERDFRKVMSCSGHKQRMTNLANRHIHVRTHYSMETIDIFMACVLPGLCCHLVALHPANMLQIQILEIVKVLCGRKDQIFNATKTFKLLAFHFFGPCVQRSGTALGSPLNCEA